MLFCMQILTNHKILAFECFVATVRYSISKIHIIIDHLNPNWIATEIL